MKSWNAFFLLNDDRTSLVYFYHLCTQNTQFIFPYITQNDKCVQLWLPPTRKYAYLANEQALKSILSICGSGHTLKALDSIIDTQTPKTDNGHDLLRTSKTSGQRAKTDIGTRATKRITSLSMSNTVDNNIFVLTLLTRLLKHWPCRLIPTRCDYLDKPVMQIFIQSDLEYHSMKV